jgi:major membrane immunogen (membrane-anchored lipoprotein)
MKRFFVVVLLASVLLTGCTKSEPSTVATISPGTAIEMVGD